MVGALADWFAVTALFRHPLGLPIPHTAIIPRKKDQIGDSLGDFVGENFLAEHVVRDKLETRRGRRARGRVDVGAGAHAERVTAELATVAARSSSTVLRDDDVQQVIDQVLVRKLAEPPWGPPLGAVLEGLLADGAHHRLSTSCCDRAYDWVAATPATVHRTVVEPRLAVLVAAVRRRLVADRVLLEVQNFAWAVQTDPEHPLRKAVDTFLVEFAADLQHDPATIARAERIKEQVMAHDEVQRFIGQAWRRSSARPRRRRRPVERAARAGARRCCALGERLRDDAELRDKVDGWLVRARGLRRAALPARDHLDHHRHGRALGRRGDQPQGRAAGGPGPAVHPDQRHGGGRAGRAGDLHGGAAIFVLTCV